jgi:hypothetical protein
LLWILKQFFKEESDWEFDLNFFISKSIEDCQKRWSLITQNQSPAVEKKKFELSQFEAFQPQGLEQIPLLPFLQICHYLNPQEIFNLLPRVCRQYNWLVQGNQIPIRRLKIDHPLPTDKLIALERKISSCLMLELTWTPELIERVKTIALENLLKKICGSVVVLYSVTHWRPMISNLIAQGRNLQGLLLIIPPKGQGWNWDLQEPCLSLKVLFFQASQLTTREILVMFTKFPNLEDVSLWVRESARCNERDFRDLRVPMAIRSYESEIMLSFLQLSQAQEISLFLPKENAIRKLIEMIPSLKFLKRIKMRIRDSVLDKMLNESHQTDQHIKLKDLVKAVKENFSVSEIRISVDISHCSFSFVPNWVGPRYNHSSTAERILPISVL